MPYTNPWSVTIPVDTELANLLANNIRQLRLDTQDRLLSLFQLAVLPTAGSGNILDQDPLVLQDGLTFAMGATHSIAINGVDFQPPDNAASYLRNDQRIHNNSGSSTYTFYKSLPLAPGVFIKKIAYQMKGSGLGIAFTGDGGTPGSTITIGSLSGQTTGGAIAEIDIPSLPTNGYQLIAGDQYTLEATIPPTAELYSVIVTYWVPNMLALV
jgi:hypothetical protein